METFELGKVAAYLGKDLKDKLSEVRGKMRPIPTESEAVRIAVREWVLKSLIEGKPAKRKKA